MHTNLRTAGSQSNARWIASPRSSLKHVLQAASPLRHGTQAQTVLWRYTVTRTDSYDEAG